MDVLAQLYVAVVADTLDRMGLRHQVLDSSIRPRTTGRLVFGTAYTIDARPDASILENPYERELAAVDAVPDGSVLVVGTHGTLDAAVWGELLATRSAQRGCRAAVVDGAIRDVRGLEAMGMPTWSASVSANDSRGRLTVVDHGSPIVCGGVQVAAGDVVMADLDGVVVIPGDVRDEVVRAAAEKVGKEEQARLALAGGASAESVYERHGVL